MIEEVKSYRSSTTGEVYKTRGDAVKAELVHDAAAALKKLWGATSLQPSTLDALHDLAQEGWLERPNTEAFVKGIAP